MLWLTPAMPPVRVSDTLSGLAAGALVDGGAADAPGPGAPPGELVGVAQPASNPVTTSTPPSAILAAVMATIMPATAAHHIAIRVSAVVASGASRSGTNQVPAAPESIRRATNQVPAVIAKSIAWRWMGDGQRWRWLAV
jgi:hypothetical protein